jgi:hypothetical protein
VLLGSSPTGERGDRHSRPEGRRSIVRPHTSTGIASFLNYGPRDVPSPAETLQRRVRDLTVISIGHPAQCTESQHAVAKLPVLADLGYAALKRGFRVSGFGCQGLGVKRQVFILTAGA